MTISYSDNVFNDSSQGFQYFPGKSVSVGTTESLVNSNSTVADNNYGYNVNSNTHILANRIAYYDQYLTGSATVTIPTGVNYIRAIVIGASGGGGGGSRGASHDHSANTAGRRQASSRERGVEGGQ